MLDWRRAPPRGRARGETPSASPSGERRRGFVDPAAGSSMSAVTPPPVLMAHRLLRHPRGLAAAAPRRRADTPPASAAPAATAATMPPASSRCPSPGAAPRARRGRGRRPPGTARARGASPRGAAPRDHGLQQRVQQLEALVARDEDVIRKLMGLLIQKGLCTRTRSGADQVAAGPAARGPRGRELLPGVASRRWRRLRPTGATLRTGGGVLPPAAAALPRPAVP